MRKKNTQMKNHVNKNQQSVRPVIGNVIEIYKLQEAGDI